MDDDFGRAIEPMRVQLDHLLRRVDDLRETRTHLPADGSTSATELKSEAAFAGAWGSGPVAASHNGAWMLLTVGEDHLRGLVAMLDSHHPPFAHAPLVRSAIEVFARASLIAQVPLDLDLRVARWLNERLYSAAQAEQLGVPGAADKRKQIQASILDEAERRGYEIIPETKRRPPAIAERRATATQAVARLFRDTDAGGFGETSYRAYSASAHGTLYAVLDRIDPTGPRSGVGTLNATSREINLALVTGMYGYVGAVGGLMELYGWEDPNLVSEVENAFGQARQLRITP